jgi:hypothetical protein
MWPARCRPLCRPGPKRIRQHSRPARHWPSPRDPSGRTRSTPRGDSPSAGPPQKLGQACEGLAEARRGRGELGAGWARTGSFPARPPGSRLASQRRTPAGGKSLPAEKTQNLALRPAYPQNMGVEMLTPAGGAARFISKGIRLDTLTAVFAGAEMEAGVREMFSLEAEARRRGSVGACCLLLWACSCLLRARSRPGPGPVSGSAGESQGAWPPPEGAAAGRNRQRERQPQAGQDIGAAATLPGEAAKGSMTGC